MDFVRTLVEEKTGLELINQIREVEQALPETSLEKLFQINPTTYMDCIPFIIVQHLTATATASISSILRIINSSHGPLKAYLILSRPCSSQKVKTNIIGNVCRETDIMILESFPWASITPTLHCELIAKFGNEHNFLALKATYLIFLLD